MESTHDAREVDWGPIGGILATALALLILILI